MSKEAVRKPAPQRANTHQQPMPKWYSALITMGWKIPMQAKTAMPNTMPDQFIR